MQYLSACLYSQLLEEAAMQFESVLTVIVAANTSIDMLANGNAEF